MMVSHHQQDVIYLIDFGLCKKYIDEHGEIIDIADQKPIGLIGTSRYMSCNTHLHRGQGRNDDLESLGYILLYLYKGDLPWMDLGSSNKQSKLDLIKSSKLSCSISKLCQDMPRQFDIYFQYVKSLDYYDTPNYIYLKQLIKSIKFPKSENFINKGQFDWVGLKVFTKKYKIQYNVFDASQDKYKDCTDYKIQDF